MDTLTKVVFDGALNAVKGTVQGVGTVANMAVEGTIGYEVRIKRAEAAHDIAINVKKSLKERLDASGQVKDEQKFLGAVGKAIKDYEHPILSFKSTKGNGEIFQVQTQYWGNGWVPGAGFGFDIIWGGQTIWVDINYANLVEKVNPPNEKIPLECDNKICITIDDLIKYYPNGYVIPKEYTVDKNRPIIVSADGTMKYGVAGGKRRSRTRKNRKNRSQKKLKKSNDDKSHSTKKKSDSTRK